MSLKDKAKQINKKLQDLIDEEVDELRIETVINLSSDQSALFQMIRIFLQSLDANLTEDEIINLIFRNGLVYELERIKMMKEHIYGMGNLEMLADEIGMGLSDEQRNVASKQMKPPETIDEYWELGYNTIACPYCGKRAVWHEKTKDYHCLEGCRQEGIHNANGATESD